MHPQRLTPAVLLVVFVLGPSFGRAQPADPRAHSQDLQGRYETLPTAVGPEPQEGPTSPDDSARRARVVARVGDITVRVGEVEDHLATASPVERESFATPAGRRGVVDRLLRFHLLAAEAEARGVVDAAVAWTARRSERRALRQQLERDIRRDPGPIPPAPPPVEVAEQRFAIVAYADSRSAIDAWVAYNRGETPDNPRSAEVRVVQTSYGERARQGEGEQLSPALWAALFRTPLGQTSAPMRSDGGWAAVMCGGLVSGYVDEGPDESARRMLVADRVWDELRTQARADRVTGLDPAALEGVAFRLPSQALDGQRELERQTAAAAGAPPPPSSAALEPSSEAP